MSSLSLSRFLIEPIYSVINYEFLLISEDSLLHIERRLRLRDLMPCFVWSLFASTTKNLFSTYDQSPKSSSRFTISLARVLESPSIWIVLKSLE
jgi:hypothetical protein